MERIAFIELSGKVVSAQARVRMLGEQSHPVLQLVIESDGVLHQRFSCDQVFPAGAHAAAHARAMHLKPGTVVTVQAPIELAQLHLPAVTHINVKPGVPA